MENISNIIRQRIIDANRRYHVNDNIAEFLTLEEKDQLIYEVELKFEEVLRSLLIDIDTDPNSEDTAYRLARMYVNELFSGRFEHPPAVAAFPNDGSHGTNPYTGMLVIRAELKSVCAHHWQPVTGTAFIGIIPTEKVIGLSKYIRIAQHCARRGVLQEELCGNICDAIKTASGSPHVAVYIQATHGCVENRGVCAHGSLTQTTVLSGDFLNDPAVKQEFYDNVKLQTNSSQ